MIPTWLREYQKTDLMADITAGLIVGVLVIPQSLGYAVLAGLPPVYGLYAAIVPVLVYAWLGSSKIQAVGPVAITAIMTASTLSEYAEAGTAVYISMASTLAVIVGILLWLSGYFKFGWISQFISRGVASGFVSGAAVLIFVSQISYITAIDISGSNLIDYIASISLNYRQLHKPTFTLGVFLFCLFFINKYTKIWSYKSFLSASQATWLTRLFPLLLVVISILASDSLNWSQLGIKLVADIPHGFPELTLPYIPSILEIFDLLPAAGLMALITFISSNSISSHYARVRGESLDINNELKALGLANFMGGFTQSFTIAGGFSRTAINVDSGAQTLFATVITTAVMLLTLMFLGYLFTPLPYALLGAMIMSSIIGLIDYKVFLYAWQVDRADAISLLVTFVTVLIFGLNKGLVLGLLVSLASLVWQSSKPHIAIVGLLAGTEHFRNTKRHDVQTFQKLLIMRIDESLFFANAESVHKKLIAAIDNNPQASEIILMMSAVNYIDLAAQEMLENLNKELIMQNKRLHYSVVKGPVMDVIEDTPVIQELSGEVFLSTILAVQKLQ